MIQRNLGSDFISQFIGELPLDEFPRSHDSIYKYPMINEAAQDDMRRSQMAEDLLHIIMGFLYKNPHPLPTAQTPEGKIAHIVYPNMMDVRGLFGTTGIAFVTNTAYNGRAVLLHSSSNLSHEGNKLNYLIMIRVDDDSDNRALYHQLCRSDIRDTFRHEAQHIIDMRRRKTKKSQDGEIKTDGNSTKEPEDYFNSPEELNAFFHNVAEPILERLRWLHKHGSDHHGILSDLPDTYQEFLSQRLVQLYGSKRLFWQYANQTNKRKVISRLARLYDLLEKTQVASDKYKEFQEDNNV